MQNKKYMQIKTILASSRNKNFTASSMKDLFNNIAARNIINFIKESHFYSTV